MWKIWLGSAAAIGLGATYAHGQTGQEGRLVEAYTAQLIEQCNGGAAATSAATATSVAAAVSERVDLDGDGRAEVVIDTSRVPCPGRPAVVEAAGPPVTIFRSADGGPAVPVFQRAAYGTRLQRKPSGPPVLWLTLGGSDCGASTPETRCERQLVWSPSAGFKLSPETGRATAK